MVSINFIIVEVILGQSESIRGLTITVLQFHTMRSLQLFLSDREPHRVIKGSSSKTLVFSLLSMKKCRLFSHFYPRKSVPDGWARRPQVSCSLDLLLKSLWTYWDHVISLGPGLSSSTTVLSASSNFTDHLVFFLPDLNLVSASAYRDHLVVS